MDRLLGSAAAARIVMLLVATALAVASVSAAAEESGEVLYRRFCASCHGLEGRGDGPAGAALCKPPADLTRLESNPTELMRQIDGRRLIRAHGTSQMPVWGEVFEQSLFNEPYRRRTALQQVQALADYVSKLRARKEKKP